MVINVYGIESKSDGTKIIHSFSERRARAAWVAEDPARRAEAVANSRIVQAAKYESQVVAH